MLRYRSYSVDFLRKPKEMLSEADITSAALQMAGAQDSGKTQLQTDLYQSALEQLKVGLEKENYFEVICLCQAIMNERIGSLLQKMQGVEDKFKLLTELEETVANLLSYIELCGETPEPNLSALLQEICTGEKGHRWVDRRDTSLNEYLLVLNDNMGFTKNLRDEFNRRTAEIGVQLALRAIKITQSLLDNYPDHQGSAPAVR